MFASRTWAAALERRSFSLPTPLLMVKGVDPAQIEGAGATPPAALALSSQDLQKVLGLLALAADRGAFQIQEFRDVGTLWTKLDGLVRSQPKP